ncbi:odorant receptor 94a-like [Cotesia typhae]|uniref:odorant receptor 94a-like n=1 Tax=Cotesia typhae TaxID=2053667 RepID=UPI003D68A4A1
MEIFRENLTLLFYLGVWKPSKWMTSNVTEFINNFFMITAIFSGCVKLVIFLRYRDSFDKIIDDLKKYLLNDSNTKEEMDMWNRTSKKIRYLAIFAVYTNCIGLIFFTSGFVGNIKNRELLYRAWVPYNYSQPAKYSATVLNQFVAVCILSFVNIGFMLLFFAIMISICAELSIFQSKFQRYFSYIDYHQDDCCKNIHASKLIGEMVDTYHSIIRLFGNVHSLLSWVILFEYCIGAVIFCTSAYYMSRMKVFSVEFISCASYITEIMLDLFIVCFSCNEVTLEFQKLHGTFYDCHWYMLNNEDKKSLGFMMVNSINPIYFTSGYVINLSIESFTKVIKVSYSIYNVLQSTL